MGVSVCVVWVCSYLSLYCAFVSLAQIGKWLKYVVAVAENRAVLSAICAHNVEAVVVASLLYICNWKLSINLNALYAI